MLSSRLPCLLLLLYHAQGAPERDLTSSSFECSARPDKTASVLVIADGLLTDKLGGSDETRRFVKASIDAANVLLSRLTSPTFVCKVTLRLNGFLALTATTGNVKTTENELLYRRCNTTSSDLTAALPYTDPCCKLATGNDCAGLSERCGGRARSVCVVGLDLSADAETRRGCFAYEEKHKTCPGLGIEVVRRTVGARLSTSSSEVDTRDLLESLATWALDSAKLDLEALIGGGDIDAVILFTSVDLAGDHVGLGVLGGMCSKRSVSLVSVDDDADVSSIGLAIAHEVGHTLGMEHDTVESSPAHVMATYSHQGTETWSEESRKYANTWFDSIKPDADGACMDNNNNNNVAAAFSLNVSVCGDGVVSGNEECDAGFAAHWMAPPVPTPAPLYPLPNAFVGSISSVWPLWGSAAGALISSLVRIGTWHFTKAWRASHPDKVALLEEVLPPLHRAIGAALVTGAGAGWLAGVASGAARILFTANVYVPSEQDRVGSALLFDHGKTCCTPHCTLRPGCECASGSCCSAAGKILPRGTTCRAKADASSCDSTEECDGVLPSCPPDKHAFAGMTCTADDAESSPGVCFRKYCRTANEECARVFKETRPLACGVGAALPAPTADDKLKWPFACESLSCRPAGNTTECQGKVQGPCNALPQCRFDTASSVCVPDCEATDGELAKQQSNATELKTLSNIACTTRDDRQFTGVCRDGSCLSYASLDMHRYCAHPATGIMLCVNAADGIATSLNDCASLPLPQVLRPCRACQAANEFALVRTKEEEEQGGAAGPGTTEAQYVCRACAAAGPGQVVASECTATRDTVCAEASGRRRLGLALLRHGHGHADVGGATGVGEEEAGARKLANEGPLGVKSTTCGALPGTLSPTQPPTPPPTLPPTPAPTRPAEALSSLQDGDENLDALIVIASGLVVFKLLYFLVWCECGRRLRGKSKVVDHIEQSGHQPIQSQYSIREHTHHKHTLARDHVKQAAKEYKAIKAVYASKLRQALGDLKEELETKAMALQAQHGGNTEECMAALRALRSKMGARMAAAKKEIKAEEKEKTKAAKLKMRQAMLAEEEAHHAAAKHIQRIFRGKKGRAALHQQHEIYLEEMAIEELLLESGVDMGLFKHNGISGSSSGGGGRTRSRDGSGGSPSSRRAQQYVPHRSDHRGASRSTRHVVGPWGGGGRGKK